MTIAQIVMDPFGNVGSLFSSATTHASSARDKRFNRSAS